MVIFAPILQKNYNIIRFPKNIFEFPFLTMPKFLFIYFSLLFILFFETSCGAQNPPKEDEKTLKFARILALYPNPKTAQEFIIRGTARRQINDFRDAIRDFNKALEFDKNTLNQQLEAFFGRATCKKKLEDFSGAINDLNSIIFLDKNNAQAYFERGLIRAEGKDLSGACLEFQKAKQLGFLENIDEMIKKYCL